MLRIDSISVRNFKNVLADELALTNFNVLVGPNNSGKSNLIQVISFLDYIINGPSDEVKRDLKGAFFSYFGAIKPQFNMNNEGIISISLKFSETSTKTQYSYSVGMSWKHPEEKAYPIKHKFVSENFEYRNIHKTGPSISIFTRDKKKVSFNKSLKKSFTLEEIETNVCVASFNRFWLHNANLDSEIIQAFSALNNILKTETIYLSNLELTRSSANRVNYYAGRNVSLDVIREIEKLSNNEVKFNFFKETLNQILKIDDIKIFELKADEEEIESDQEPEILVLFRHLGRLKTFWELSDGSIILIALVTKIITTKESIFLIEEPENSLHPKALVEFISFLRSFEDEKQFIIASHSIPVINSIKPDDVIISTCEENGRSIFNRVSNIKELNQKLKRGYIVFSDALFFNSDYPN